MVGLRRLGPPYKSSRFRRLCTLNTYVIHPTIGGRQAAVSESTSAWVISWAGLSSRALSQLITPGT